VLSTVAAIDTTSEGIQQLDVFGSKPIVITPEESAHYHSTSGRILTSMVRTKNIRTADPPKLLHTECLSDSSSPSSIDPRRRHRVVGKCSDSTRVTNIGTPFLPATCKHQLHSMALPRPKPTIPCPNQHQGRPKTAHEYPCRLNPLQVAVLPTDVTCAV
jgi:hypothetical protein